MQRLKSIVRRLIPIERAPYLKEFQSAPAEIAQLYRTRLKHIIPVEQPLVLISQVQRSGGTLVSQLLDGHPQIHTHPHELYIGHPRKWDWPDLDLSAPPETWFALLFEKPTAGFFRDGYEKHPASAQYEQPDVFPFFLLPNLQREIFLSRVAAREIKTQRDVLNCYMTSYFNAWLNYQQHYHVDKKYIAAFTPRVNMHAGALARFFRDYPDGRLISMVRDPKAWYVSSHRKSPQNHPDPQASIPIWKESAEATLAAKAQYGDKVFVLGYENLVKDTEGHMRALAEWLGIEFDEILLRPTFQGMDIRANSAYAVQTYGVIDAPLQRAKELSEQDAAYIDAEALALYERVLAEADYRP
jgi:hypothetical protein